MKYVDLPKTIIHPITNEVLELQEFLQNDCEISIAQFLECSTEYFDGPIAMYRDKYGVNSIYLRIDGIKY